MNLFKSSGLFNQLKLSLVVQSTRGHKMDVMHSWTGGVKHHGFTYYPRPGQVDPPYEPTKLFMVQRTQTARGKPVKLKRIMNSIGLGETSKPSDIAIVKNTTDMNARLWRIKHLVKITPITTPDGLPMEGNYTSCHLDSNGVFRVTPELKLDEERIASKEKFIASPKKMKPDVWKKECRLRWMRDW